MREVGLVLYKTLVSQFTCSHVLSPLFPFVSLVSLLPFSLFPSTPILIPLLSLFVSLVPIFTPYSICINDFPVALFLVLIYPHPCSHLFPFCFPFSHFVHLIPICLLGFSVALFLVPIDSHPYSHLFPICFNGSHFRHSYSPLSP